MCQRFDVFLVCHFLFFIFFSFFFCLYSWQSTIVARSEKNPGAGKPKKNAAARAASSASSSMADVWSVYIRHPKSLIQYTTRPTSMGSVIISAFFRNVMTNQLGMGYFWMHGLLMVIVQDVLLAQREIVNYLSYTKILFY